MEPSSENVADASQAPLFYLWHLASIGLLDPERPGAIPQIWGESLPPSRVAIIDSGCTSRHPNLPSYAIEGRLDVCISAEGVVYGEEDVAATAEAWQRLEDAMDPILRSIDDRKVKAELERRIEAMAARSPRLVSSLDPAQRFSGHGTSCAGLVAGRTLRNPPPGSAPVLGEAVLPYFGVNPYATIIPVATPYSHEIAPLITALLHAVAWDADVILLPRSVNDIVGPDSKKGGVERRSTRFDTHPALLADKKIFEHLLASIAADRPVILASGNDGADEPAYPASLVNDKNAPRHAKHLIVVGAGNHLGWRSSYSNGTYATGVLVYGPSDDEETINERVTRIDQAKEFGTAYNKSVGLTQLEPSCYSPFSVLAIDVPGRLAGGSDLDDETTPLTTPLLYTRFGGTSAASAIIAGIASLIQAKARGKLGKRLSGAMVHDIFEKCRPPGELALGPSDGWRQRPEPSQGFVQVNNVIG